MPRELTVQAYSDKLYKEDPSQVGEFERVLAWNLKSTTMSD
jgi:hypothetical protein